MLHATRPGPPTAALRGAVPQREKKNVQRLFSYISPAPNWVFSFVETKKNNGKIRAGSEILPGRHLHRLRSDSVLLNVSGSTFFFQGRPEKAGISGPRLS